MTEIIISFSIAAIISIAWANAISKQNKNFHKRKNGNFLDY